MNISKQTLERALDSASFPVVAALLVHFTGDISILHKLPKPNKVMLVETQGFLSDEDKQTISSRTTTSGFGSSRSCYDARTITRSFGKHTRNEHEHEEDKRDKVERENKGRARRIRRMSDRGRKPCAHT